MTVSELDKMHKLESRIARLERQQDEHWQMISSHHRFVSTLKKFLVKELEKDEK